MKKFVIAFLLSIAFLTNTTCFGENTIVHSAKYEHYNVIEQTVYRTETGRKYHLSSCRYLKYSKIPMKKTLYIVRGLLPAKFVSLK